MENADKKWNKVNISKSALPDVSFFIPGNSFNQFWAWARAASPWNQWTINLQKHLTPTETHYGHCFPWFISETEQMGMRQGTEFLHSKIWLLMRLSNYNRNKSIKRIQILITINKIKPKTDISG